MSVTDIFGLLGGLALFIQGMQMMRSGLVAAAGNKMKRILERLTANRFLRALNPSYLSGSLSFCHCRFVCSVCRWNG